MDNIFVRLRACEQSQRGVTEQIHSWRTLFSAAGTSLACQQQDASEQMQISPVGAEGSNVMPGQPARAEAAEVRRNGMQSTLLTHVGRDGTPHAGSTAGEGAQPSTALYLLTARPPGKVMHAQACLSVSTHASELYVHCFVLQKSSYMQVDVCSCSSHLACALAVSR